MGKHAMREGNHTVDDHNFLGRFLLAEFVEDSIDSLTEHDSVSTGLPGRTDIEERGGSRLDVVENFGGEIIGVTTGLEIVDGGLDGNNIVSMGRTLDISDTWSHKSVSVLPSWMSDNEIPGAINLFDTTEMTC